MITKLGSQVHQFSRDFVDITWSAKYQRKISRGYNKEIGNYDIAVPQKIRDAVTDNKFRINDSYPPYLDNIALIGRQIDNYSILAVATSGIDDGNRPLVAYQYYWLEKDRENEDGLGQLLEWWYQQNQPCNELTNISNYSRTKSKKLDQKWINRQYKLITKKPFIVNNKTFENNSFPSVIEIHELAKKLRKDYKSPLTWAWNITSLDYPESFTLICSADEKSYQWIVFNIKAYSPIQESFISSNANKLPREKSSIKNALKNVAKNSKFEKNLKFLAEKLEEEDSYKWEWDTILEKALLKNSQDNSGVRYRSLLLILMPTKEIDEHIQLLMQKGNLKKRNQLIETQQKFLEIIKENQLEKADNLINENIDNIIEKLLINCIELNDKSSQGKLYLQWIQWLLTKNNFWKIKLFDYGKELIDYLLLENKKYHDDFLFKEVKNIISDSQRTPDEKYKILADIFAISRQYTLAGLLYQISLGFVPKDIYRQIDYPIIPLQEGERTSGLVKLCWINTIDDFKNLLAAALDKYIKK